MKKLLSLILCVAILVTAITTVSANTYTTQSMAITVDYVNIYVNGQQVWMHNFVHEGTTYIGLRDAANTFGYEVSWDDSTKTASFKAGTQATPVTEIPSTQYYFATIDALVDYADIVINNIPVEVRNFINNGTTYVSLRDLGTLFNYTVGWDSETRTATLDKVDIDFSKVTGTVNKIEIPSYLIKVEGQNASSSSSEETIRQTVEQGAVIYAFVETYKNAYGISVTDEEIAQIESSFENIVQQEFGGKEIFEIILAQENITFDEYKAYYITVATYDIVYAKLYDIISNDQNIKNENVESARKYYEENIASFTLPTVRVKHILIPTVDLNTGAPLSDKEKAAAKTKASSIYNSVKKKPNNFDSYIAQNNNDPGMPKEGYYIYEGSGMVEEFESAALKLSKNQISPVTETSYGYHIIKAIETYKEIPFEALYAFDAETYINDLINQWYATAVIDFNW